MTGPWQDGNVIYATFPGRRGLTVSLDASTELVYQDDLATVFRFTVNVNGELAVCRHVLLEPDA